MGRRSFCFIKYFLMISLFSFFIFDVLILLIVFFMAFSIILLVICCSGKYVKGSGPYFIVIAPLFANLSAVSLPVMPMCAFTLYIDTVMLFPVNLFKFIFVSLVSFEDDVVAFNLCIVVIESVWKFTL